MAVAVRKAILLGIGHICLVYGGEQGQLVLLQQRASVIVQNDDVDVVGAGAGSKAPINEKGYGLVADLKDDKEMQTFIRRAVRADARYVKDISDFMGVVPFYSGSKSVQSYGALKEEIRRANWVGESDGRVAPLSEDGYQKVASLQHSPDMIAFARRILDDNHKKCNDEGALAGLVAYYDGKNVQQNFATLQKELLAASWIGSRDAAHREQEIPADRAPTTEKDPDTVQGGQKVSADKVMTMEDDGDALVYGDQEIGADSSSSGSSNSSTNSSSNSPSNTPFNSSSNSPSNVLTEEEEKEEEKEKIQQ